MSYTAHEAQAALAPQFDAYSKAIEGSDWDTVATFYHPNGVIVQKGKEAFYGKDAIKAELLKFSEATGRSTSSFSNQKYEGAGDYLIITADFSSETEKAGTVKGKFVQIWKKEGDRHLIYHDEFEVNP
ncbi:DUF4440 domain-containing protein [Caenorhabditis elegans]|uniref:DUF4440 domain-containing protein n=1 Tax=Caenorhabditis elegans TaxID=6239 RepID=Q9U315_CAEEL|nr:DUF4440 domain-containing protein [Caenorhabditis elegans]CAB60313.1 DUF4440 domain-containing protein [Caenorhabditis elegans]|eukprot:NP_502894.1 Uncharacterized protein CELE_Y105C5B.5 [Caenorhabditis elegans]